MVEKLLFCTKQLAILERYSTPHNITKTTKELDFSNCFVTLITKLCLKADLIKVVPNKPTSKRIVTYLLTKKGYEVIAAYNLLRIALEDVPYHAFQPVQ